MTPKLTTLLLVFWTISAWGQTVSLPPPSGDHSVGYATLDLETGQADDLSTQPGDRRTLKLEIWYPATPSPSHRAGPAFSPKMQDALSEQFPFPHGFANATATHSVVNAEAAGQSLPVVLFSPGLSFPVSLYQTFAEQLASNGFVFVGVNHPHGVSFIEYADGSTLDRSAWPAFDDREERERFLAEHASVWEADLIETLKWIREGAKKSPIAGHVSLERIGGLGHSYGGTATGRLARDGLIKAAVILEGAVRDPKDSESRGFLTTSAPLMHVIGGYNRLEMEGRQYRPSRNAPVYQIIINGAGHAHLSDLILLYAQVADDEWHARHRYELEPDRILKITTDHILAMFDHYLLGREANVLLRPRSSADRTSSPSRGGYPEVELSIAID